jgi:hypothetical protein
MATALVVDHTAKIISQTIFALLGLRGWRGTVRFTPYIDADANSVHVVPEVLLDG